MRILFASFFFFEFDFLLTHSVFFTLFRNRYIEGNTMQSLPSVYELTLQHNPWRCDCGLRSFRNWMVERLIPLSYSPNCSTPQRLFGKSWSQLELEEFACPPDVVSVDTEVVVYEGKKKIFI